MTTRTSRRAGGRQARQALRAAPLAKDSRPVRAGLEGGAYKPLTPEGMERIHQAALDALEQIGLADAPPSGVEIMTKAGAILGDDGRLRFPRALVEDMLAKAAKDLTLCARDPQHDLNLAGTRVHYGTAGAAVHMVDVDGREYRDSTVQDLHDAARIVDQLDNIHFLQRPMVCRDIPDNREMDLNSIYASVTGTKKHIGVSFTEPDFVDDGIELLHMMAGGEDKWRARPFVSNSNCFVVPPMKFATESCQVMEKVIAAGMPVLLLSAGMATATAPAHVAGTIVQAVAECLAGVVYVNAIKPGHPAIFGTWPLRGRSAVWRYVGRIRRAGFAYRWLLADAPVLWASRRRCGGVLGFETARYASRVGADVLERDGGPVWFEHGVRGCRHACVPSGFCHESLILGNDIIGQALRCVRGIEVTEDAVSLDMMRSVCLGGPGHYLGEDQTLNLMQTEYAYPTLGDRTSPKEWGRGWKA